MDSEGKISSWIAKLWGCFGVLCAEAYDVFPQEPIDHVRDQILTAGESLKQFYFDLTKDVFPVSKQDSPQEDVPTSAKQKESTGLPPDDKSTISADDSEEGKSDDVPTSAKPKENTGLPPDDKSTINADDSEEGKSEDAPTSAKQKENTGLPPDNKSTISADDSEEGKSEAAKPLSPASYVAFGGEVHISLVPKEEGVIRTKRGVSEDLPADEFKSDIVSTLESECSAEIQEHKMPSAGAIEHDALAELLASPQPLVVGSCDDKDDISDVLDPEFSTEIQDCKVPDDESLGEIHSIPKGSVQSLEDSSEETEEIDSSTESESSSEESTSTDDEVTSSVSTISTRTSSSDTTIFGNEPLDQLPEIDLLVEPSNLDSTMFEHELQSGLLQLGFLDSDSDSDTSDYSSSEETPKSDTGVARPIEEQKLDDSISQVDSNELCSESELGADHLSYQETDEPPLSDVKFVEEGSCETGSQGSTPADAGTNRENAEASQDKEWERLDDESSDSGWEIV